MKQKGFTLIELLVVITLIGVLAGILVSVINAPVQRARAQDGVKQNTMSSLVTALETHAAMEGSYPEDPTTSNYVKNWPTSDYNYARLVDGTFVLWVEKSEYAGQCYKYHSSWGYIHSCTLSCANNADKTGCTPL